MRILGLLLLCLSLPILAANTITTQIHDVDYGNHPGDEILVFLKSGDVVKLPRWDSELLENFHEAKSSDSWFSITVDSSRNILKVQDAEAPLEKLDRMDFFGMDEINYVPTTVASMAKAKEYIRESRHPHHPETQCFNRALVWTYEWWKKHSLRSMKVLVFWSKDFVRRHSFKWWFHIAPYVHVMDENGKVVERVLDVKWLSTPYEFGKWVNYHSNPDRTCKMVTKYSDYANYPYGHDCYLMRTNMYTYQPADLEMNEAWGYTKNAFNLDEVRAAYLEAFGIHF